MMVKKTVRIGGVDVADGDAIDLNHEDMRLADGTRLIEARADDLTQEVLCHAGRGRPALTAPGRRSPQWRLSVPGQTLHRLRARAEAKERSVSEIAREALDRYLASSPADTTGGLSVRGTDWN